jgi:hypothetical protein
MGENAIPAPQQGRLAKLTAAPLTIELDGERFELAPLTLRQWAQLKRFAQERAAEELCRGEAILSKAGASKDFLDRFRARAIMVLEHPLDAWPADDHEVRVERVLMSLRPAHPDITREKVEALLDAEVNRLKVERDLAELASMEAGLKNARRARRRARAGTATPRPSGSTSSRASATGMTGRRTKSRG